MFNFFRRLHWKLAISYILVTSIVALIVLLIVWTVITGLIVQSGQLPRAAQILATSAASEASVYFRDGTVDREGIATWLNSMESDSVEINFNSENPDLNFSLEDIGSLTVLDIEGNVIDGLPKNDILSGNIVTQFDENIGAAYIQSRNAVDVFETHGYEKDGDSHIFIPIFDPSNNVVGTLYAQLEIPAINENGEISAIVGILLGVAVILPLMVFVVIVSLVFGLIFGWLASRGFVRRLHRLSTSADSWSNGDFSVQVVDKSGDEIGQLGRRLNRMADQLQLQIDTQSHLSAVEERNRIARDLHDSAKQQIFATSMQLSTAKALIDTHPTQAKDHLIEAEILAKQVQKELSGLIQELRPAQLEGTGLFDAVASSAETWGRQNNVEVVTHVQGKRDLPLNVEQTMFRIIQEALNNIGKHSQASKVDVRLSAENENFQVTIRDNGIGFNTDGTDRGIGLNSMRERVEELGGDLTIKSEKGVGTLVRATCPIPYKLEI